MKNPTRFRAYEPDQGVFLPVDLEEWLPKSHLVYFVRDVVQGLDLSAIYASYSGAKGGQPPYHPQLMVSLLVYGYCQGIASSRRLEEATYDSLPFRVLTCDSHPDHDTIAEFRRRHLGALADLFVQVLRLCQKAGLVRLGHIALDGTKMRANASKHKAMSYGRMVEKEGELAEEVKALLAEAERLDASEDAAYGTGKRREELPKDLQFKEERLRRIREARQALEAEARAEAAKKAKAAGDDVSRAEEQAKPKDKAQRNFTDPQSRIMKSGGSFEQCYNCQAAVDAHAQIIVAAEATQEANDKQQMQPMLDAMKKNLQGALPKEISADNGYYSDGVVETVQAETIDPYIHPGSKELDEPWLPCRGPMPQDATIRQTMARKLRTIRGRAAYSKRKETVEPVFGQIKQARRFRQFLLRGLRNVQGEWRLICLGHNLLKLFRSQWEPERT